MTGAQGKAPKAKKGKGRSHLTLKDLTIIFCPKCGKPIKLLVFTDITVITK